VSGSRLACPGRLDLAATVDSIAAEQLPGGQIPWFAGGHTDPWNHVEAAMALTAGARWTEAEAAYGWLAASQRPDGAWHQYYVGDRVEEATLDANVTAYVATGTWHHFLATADRGFLETMFPVVEAAVGFVLALQRPDGTVTWARHADGTPWPFALLTASSSTYLSLRCAVAAARELGRPEEGWAEAAARLGAALRRRPGAFAPKDRWAMDWYYPVLVGAVAGDAAARRLDSGRSGFVLPGAGVRCVADKAWVTAAETCECAMAHVRAGRRDDAEGLWLAAQHLRADDGSYHTGMVHPQRIHFPWGERTTYSAAAVVLAADALWGAGPTARLFLDDPASRSPGN